MEEQRRQDAAFAVGTIELQKAERVAGYALQGDGNAQILAQILDALNGIRIDVNGLRSEINAGFNGLKLAANHKLYDDVSRISLITNNNHQYPAIGDSIAYSDYMALTRNEIVALLEFYGLETPQRNRTREQCLQQLSTHLNVIPVVLGRY